MSKFKVGQLVRILPSPPRHNSCPECRRRYPGTICTIIRGPWIDRRGLTRYEVDVPSHHDNRNLRPVESVLAPVSDPPPQEKTTWEEFIKLTGIDPRKEPVRVD